MKHKKKIVICIDMDNVLADFDGGIGREEFEWNPPEMYRKEFFYKLKPVRGAKSAIKQLMKIPNVQLFIASIPVTRPGGLKSATDKLRWLEKHFPYLLHHFCLVSDKMMVKGDFLIDDHPTNPRVRDFPGEIIFFDHKNPCKSWTNVVKYLKGRINDTKRKSRTLSKNSRISSTK